MDKDVLFCVVAVDETVSRLDVEPLDRARDVFRKDGLCVIFFDSRIGRVVVGARDVLVGHF